MITHMGMIAVSKTKKGAYEFYGSRVNVPDFVANCPEKYKNGTSR